MKFKLVLLFALLAVSLPLAFAQTTEDEQLTKVTTMYNNQVRNLPNFAKGFLGDESLHIYFTDDTGVKTEYAAITKNGEITEIAKWIDSNNNGNHDLWQDKGISPTMAVYLDQATLTKIWQADDSASEFKKAWGKEIKYKGLTFGTKFKTFFMGIGMRFAGFFKPKQAPAAPSLKSVGEVCEHGGECETGNCVGVGQGPPWTYKCSCDPFRFVAAGTDGECPVGSQTRYEEPDTLKQVGEECLHGGECETGNCIGVIPGQLYKCSCDPFEYDEYNC